MERDFGTVEAQGAAIQYNRAYVSKKTNHSVKPSVRLAFAGDQFPKKLNKDLLMKIWLLRENQDFMQEVYPGIE